MRTPDLERSYPPEVAWSGLQGKGWWGGGAVDPTHHSTAQGRIPWAPKAPKQNFDRKIGAPEKWEGLVGSLPGWGCGGPPPPHHPPPTVLGIPVRPCLWLTPACRTRQNVRGIEALAKSPKHPDEAQAKRCETGTKQPQGNQRRTLVARNLVEGKGGNI